MIIYIAQGQLGNQLFQYAFLKSRTRSGEVILSLGFDNILEVFEIDEKVINIPKNKITKYLKGFELVLQLLAKLKIISCIKPLAIEVIRGYVKEDVQIVESKGLLKHIKYVKTASYESEFHIDHNIKKDLKIKSKYLQKAKEFLKELDGKTKVFVHLRLGDYDNYTALGKSVKLPITYYLECLDSMAVKVNFPHFVFISNDSSYIEDSFNHIDRKFISKNDMGTDFAIMTLCNYGVISASTFSFWGAYLMKEREEVYAPKYWKGFRSGIEYPIQGFPSFATPIGV